MRTLAILLLLIALLLAPPAAPAHAGRSFPAAPLPLSAYPRPPADNGLGVHWSTYLFRESDAAADYFVAELGRLNVRWVKLLVDGTRGREHDRAVERLAAAGIMPVLRLYRECNDRYDAAELDAQVRHYVGLGAYYFELYNEPGLAGRDGGWCGGDGRPKPEHLAKDWAAAARTVYAAGGYPSLPSMFAPSKARDGRQDAFFYRFFDALRRQGDEATLYYSWGAVHNYTLNHPPTYPFDDVNLDGAPLTPAEIARYGLSPDAAAAIDRARETARGPGGYYVGADLDADSTGFLHFVAWRQQFHALFGFDIPLIATEGGATPGAADDPRYPPVDAAAVAEWTRWTADYLLDDAPPYLFASCTWLLAQRALDYDTDKWEASAWYHDRAGGAEPVVRALAERPRVREARPPCTDADADCPRAAGRPVPPVSLADYPRPPADNGRGVHWAPTGTPVDPPVVDYFVGELRAMNVKWLKLLQDDSPGVAHPYLLRRLQEAGIEPVLRVYKRFNEPYAHLAELAPAAAEFGVHYFELYCEPNVAGPDGGWPDGAPIDAGRLADLWLVAARTVRAAGGHPGLPPLAPGGTVDDLRFLRRFLSEVRARGGASLLPRAWLGLHNYFLNHPLDYPADPVNRLDTPLTPAEIAARGLSAEQAAAIDRARLSAHVPHEQGGFWVGDTIDLDSNAFRKFEAYEHIFAAAFGYELPVIGVEGGAIEGAAEDPRYPPVTDADVAALTLGAYRALLDDAPPYFFAQTAWLLANKAAGGADERFEHAAWYKDRAGTALPVVAALKADPRRLEARK